MMLKYQFDMMELDDGIIAVPVGNSAEEIHGILKLNKEGKELLELLKSQSSEDMMVDVLVAKYDNNRQELVKFVHNFVEMLRENDLIKE